MSFWGDKSICRYLPYEKYTAHCKVVVACSKVAVAVGTARKALFDSSKLVNKNGPSTRKWALKNIHPDSVVKGAHTYVLHTANFLAYIAIPKT